MVCHKHGLPLIVDEAHGAHLGLAPGFPPSAMQQGADISVQSTHKTLNSLGQASMLHARGNLVDFDRLAECLRLLQVGRPGSHMTLTSPALPPLSCRLMSLDVLQCVAPGQQVAARQRVLWGCSGWLWGSLAFNTTLMSARALG